MRVIEEFKGEHRFLSNYYPSILVDRNGISYPTAEHAFAAANLIEGNTWHDQYWGSCSCPRHVHIDGKNALGILLMNIRLDVSSLA